MDVIAAGRRAEVQSAGTKRVNWTSPSRHTVEKSKREVRKNEYTEYGVRIFKERQNRCVKWEYYEISAIQYCISRQI